LKNYTSSIFHGLKGKKIIIAGCNGYIGSALCYQLELNNISYIGIDKTKTNRNSISFNLIEYEKIKKIIKEEDPDIFFHTATHSALAYKNEFLSSFKEDNIALFNILSSLKLNKNKARLIYFSSSYVYSGHKKTDIVNEETILKPTHNFGLAKHFFEQLIYREYKNSNVFRLSSVFGQGEYLHPNAIEVMTKEAINNRLVTVWGSGDRKMQYIFLEDVVKCLFLADTFKTGLFNLCGNNYVSVKETASFIAKFFEINVEFLDDKVEGETLPQMANNKVSSESKLNLFSDHSDSLTNYLKTIKK
tara:strand:+ start:3002 stop:3910 length:909 start_codon:yes stop_codon:yes gene_type:complete